MILPIARLLLTICIVAYVPLFASAQDLVVDTVALDIRTASYYELLAWAERLELPTRGSRAELQSLLANYYGVEIGAPRADSESESDSDRSIRIDSANSTKYFTLEESDENYLELHGDVVLTMQDADSGSIHTIEADRIVFNQDTNELTASGNLSYTLDQGDSVERFHGDSLSFSLDDWEGVFTNGTSTVDRDLDENLVTFYYSGKTIYRLADDVILLDQGRITSSNPDDPYYRIDAASIRILAPQEWVVEDALLYVGHVPVFYFPFFFHPGDELFFHPAVGVHDIQGYFVQTTSYLIGEKLDTTGSLSFLRASDESSGSYDTELEGLFLRKLRRGGQSNGEETLPNEDYLKILADIYSRHGLFLGIEGSIRNAGAVESFETLFGIVRSRDIVTDDDRGYTYLTPSDDDGTYGSTWNQTYILGTLLPLRFGGGATLGVRGDWFNLTINVDAHSDPFVSRDFFKRGEEIDWAALLGIDEDDAASGASGTRVDAFQWRASVRANPRLPTLSPFVQSLQVSRLEGVANWRSKARPDSDFGVNPEFEPLGFLHPDRYFFYPDSMTTPGFAMRIAGTLFNQTYGAAASVRGPATRERLPDLRPPWESPVAEVPPSEQLESEPELRVPAAIGSEAVARLRASPLYTHQLTYNIAPAIALDSRFDSASWDRPQAVNSDREFSLIDGRITTQINYRGNGLDSAISITEAINVQGTLREHFGPADPGDLDTDAWRRLIDQDQSTSLFRGTNTLGITLKPLLGRFGDSSLNYELGSTLYQYVYDTIEATHTSKFIEWSEDFITTHRLTTALAYSTPIGNQSLTFKGELPPRDVAIDVTGRSVAGWFATMVTAGIALVDDSWNAGPITLTERITPDLELIAGSFLESNVTYDPEERMLGESRNTLQFSALDGKIAAQQLLRIDLDAQEVLESTTTLNLWSVEARFSAAKTLPFSFTPGIGWSAGAPGTEELRPRLARIALNYQTEERFWKNRIVLKGGVTTAWDLDLIRVTDSSLRLDTTLSLIIAEFLMLEFESHSEHRSSYRYIRGLSDQVSEGSWLNPLEDILKSINFFNPSDRIEADFNLSSISLAAVHYLRDWELTLEYTGKPTLQAGETSYNWEAAVSLFIRWYPIPEIKRNFRFEDGAWIL